MRGWNAWAHASVIGATLGCASNATLGLGAAEPHLTSAPQTGQVRVGAETSPAAGAAAEVAAWARAPLRVLGAQGELEEAEFTALLARQRFVCVGETHDDAAHHGVQWQMLRRFVRAAASARLGVGFEMFDREQQGLLDRFAAGELRGEHFVQESGWEQRWGFDFELYRPLLDTAVEAQAALLALNAPKDWTKRVAKFGLDGVPEELAQALPELELDDEAHRAFFFSAMSGHPVGPANATHDTHRGLERYYQAQVVWDETMAESVSRWYAQAPSSSRAFIVAGAGHCHRSAIPARLTRRTGQRVLSVRPLRRSELGSTPIPRNSEFDLLVLVEDRGPPVPHDLPVPHEPPVPHDLPVPHESPVHSEH